ncbi:MAG: hypothetical protein AAF741_16030 [Bacteroidota bacterium]
MLYDEKLNIIPFDIQLNDNGRPVLQWGETISYEWENEFSYFIMVHDEENNFIITDKDDVFILKENEILKIDAQIDIDDYYFIYDTVSKEYTYIYASDVDASAVNFYSIINRKRPIDDLLFKR